MSSLLKRAISIFELFNTRYREVEFDAEWRALIGNPELVHSWIVWGGSSNGKTTFVLKLCNYLKQFERVAYNSIEEGRSKSLMLAAQRAGISPAESRIVLLNREKVPELIERLERPKSPNIVVVDSIQALRLTYDDYETLKSRFPNKLFIYVSRAEGKEPKGNVAQEIRYDANVKIRIEGFRAICDSRYGGDTPYTIWDEGAARCWGVAQN